MQDKSTLSFFPFLTFSFCDSENRMMDDALGGDEEEDQEADEMLGSVLEEVGLEVGQSV